MADDSVRLVIHVDGTQQVTATAVAVDNLGVSLGRAATTSTSTARGMNTVADSGGMAAMKMMVVAQAVDDVQYGFRSVVNNIPQIAMAFGAGAGLAGQISIAAVALNQLFVHWDDIRELWSMGDTARQTEEMKKYAAAAREAGDALLGVRSAEDTAGGKGFAEAQAASLVAGQTGQDFRDAMVTAISMQRGDTTWEQFDEAAKVADDLIGKAAVGDRGAAAALMGAATNKSVLDVMRREGAPEAGILERFAGFERGREADMLNEEGRRNEEIALRELGRAREEKARAALDAQATATELAGGRLNDDAAAAQKAADRAGRERERAAREREQATAALARDYGPALANPVQSAIVGNDMAQLGGGGVPDAMLEKRLRAEAQRVLQGMPGITQDNAFQVAAEIIRELATDAQQERLERQAMGMNQAQALQAMWLEIRQQKASAWRLGGMNPMHRRNLQMRP